MAFYGISVEEGLKSLGLEDFKGKIKNISEEYITKFLDDIKNLQKHSEWLKKYETTVLSINQNIKNYQIKIKATDKKINNGKTWNDLKNRKKVYATEEEYNQAKKNVEALLESRQNAIDVLGLDEIKEHIVSLYYLEEKIMGELYELKMFAEGRQNPVTETYVIYFHGEKHDGGSEISRVEISSTDQTFQDNLYVDLKGNLQLSYSIVKKLSSSTSVETIANSKDSSNINSIYQDYVNGLIKEVSTTYSKIVNRARMLLEQGSKKHLGGKKDSELDAIASAYLQRNTVQQLIDQHQQALRNFLYNNNNNNNEKTILAGDQVNRGHLMEAFERLYQAHKEAQPNDPQLDYATAVQDSLQNDPWYTQGDVAQKQVKSFLDGHDRQVASFISLRDLCNKLLSTLQDIVNNEKKNINKLNDITDWWINKNKSEIKAADKKVMEEYDKFVETTIKSNFKIK